MDPDTDSQILATLQAVHNEIAQLRTGWVEHRNRWEQAAEAQRDLHQTQLAQSRPAARQGKGAVWLLATILLVLLIHFTLPDLFGPAH
jgi:hypothetical protein